MPSPALVCSRMMTWPLFSPPRRGVHDEHPVEDVLVADRRPRESPAGALDARSRPPLERTLTTTMPSRQRAARQPIEGDDADQLIAVDHLAVLVDGHATVGVAVEREADVGAGRRHDRAACSGAVAPQSRLMLMPSGSLKRASTSAPVAARICGATAPPEPLAQSTTTAAAS